MTNILSSFLKINKYFRTNIGSNILSIYRIIFGICMLIHSKSIYKIFLIIHKNKDFRFPFDFFEFIQPANSLAVYSLLAFILKIAAISIIIGYRTRLFAFIYCMIYCYNLLLDMAFYNNHYYLIILILFAFIIIPTSNSLTLEHLIKKDNKTAIQLRIDVSVFRFLIILPYFMGGIAKLTSIDWITGSVIASSISEYSSFYNILGITNKQFIIYFTTYYGLIFDLGIGFLLLHKRFWCLGIIFTIPFHIANSINLNIGIFPYLMLCSNLLFVRIKKLDVQELNFVSKCSFKVTSFYIFILFHILFPLRFFLLSENANWTGKAITFSWRMKLNHVETESVNFKLIDKSNNNIIATMDSIKLSNSQLKYLCTTPNDVLKFRNNLFRKYKLEKDTNKYIFQIYLKNSLNGRNFQWVFDTTKNFTAIKYTYFLKSDFIKKVK